MKIEREGGDMRYRLIEVLKGFCRYEKCSGKQDSTICHGCYNGGELADYLLANGVILLSCKEGDIAYRLAHGYVEQEKVRCVHIQYLTNGYGFSEDDIGKVAFVGDGAEEEAKKHLRR